MLQVNRLSGFGYIVAKPFQVNAVHFDGTSDYLTRGGGLTGAADSKVGTISAWINLTGGNGAVMAVVASEGVTFGLTRLDTSELRVRAENSAGTTILAAQTSNTYTDSSGWVHILSSWDLASTTVYLYISDVVDLASTPKTVTNDTIDYTVTNWSVGSYTNANGKLNADLADLWFDDSYMNISLEANRRKFIDASGNPVNLGTTGANPTGSSPLVFMSGATDSWHTNKGTGGGFTENGALTTASTSPSD